MPISELFSVPLILVVSYLCARLVGDNWAETKALGDPQRTLEWTTGVLSAVGFSYAYVLVVVLLLENLGKLSPGAALQVTHIGYGFLAFPALGAVAVSVHHVWLTRVRRAPPGPDPQRADGREVAAPGDAGAEARPGAADLEDDPAALIGGRPRAA